VTFAAELDIDRRQEARRGYASNVITHWPKSPGVGNVAVTGAIASVYKPDGTLIAVPAVTNTSVDGVSRLRVTVDATSLDLGEDYSVIFTSTYDGTARLATVHFDVVREPFNAADYVSLNNLVSELADLTDRLGRQAAVQASGRTAEQQASLLVARAWSDVRIWIRDQLKTQGRIYPRLILDREAVCRVVVAQAISRAFRADGGGPESTDRALADDWKTEAGTRLAEMGQLAYDETDDGVADTLLDAPSSVVGTRGAGFAQGASVASSSSAGSSSEFPWASTLGTLQTDLDAEEAARAAADTALQAEIDAEETARAAADAVLTAFDTNERDRIANVRNYGAVGNGTTDDIGAFECALVDALTDYGNTSMTGTATGGTSTTIVDTGKTWTTGAFTYAGFTGMLLTTSEIAIIRGTGQGQVRNISAVTSATTLTVSVAWTTTPDATSVYAICPRYTVVSRVAWKPLYIPASANAYMLSRPFKIWGVSNLRMYGDGGSRPGLFKMTTLSNLGVSETVACSAASIASNVLTVTATAHGIADSSYVTIAGITIPITLAKRAAGTGANTFTITLPTAATTSVVVTSNVARAYVPVDHGFIAGDVISTTGHTTNATGAAISAVGYTNKLGSWIEYPLTAANGALADGIGTIAHTDGAMADGAGTVSVHRSILDLNACWYSDFRDFTIEGISNGAANSGTAPDSHVFYHRDGSGVTFYGDALQSVSGQSSRVYFTNIRCTGKWIGAAWRIGRDGNVTQEDTTSFVNCSAEGSHQYGSSNGLWAAGFRFGTGASSNNLLHNAFTIHAFGCHTGIDIWVTGFNMLGGQLAVNDLDISIRGTNGPVYIQGFRSENSTKLLNGFFGPSNSGNTVTIQDVEMRLNGYFDVGDPLYVDTDGHVRRDVVTWDITGTLILRNLRLYDGITFNGAVADISAPDGDGIQTLTQEGANFTSALIGQPVRITGATNAANNTTAASSSELGAPIVLSVPASNQITYHQPAGVVEAASPATWTFRHFVKPTFVVGTRSGAVTPPATVAPINSSRRSHLRLEACVVENASADQCLVIGPGSGNAWVEDFVTVDFQGNPVGRIVGPYHKGSSGKGALERNAGVDAYGRVRVLGLVSPPSAPLVQNFDCLTNDTIGNQGATSRDYFVVAVDASGNRSLPSAAGTQANGAAALSATQAMKISPADSVANTANVVSWDILKGTTSWKIATIRAEEIFFVDYGQIPDSELTAYTSPTRNETADVEVSGALQLDIVTVDPPALDGKARVYLKDSGSGAYRLYIRESLASGGAIKTIAVV
jgi:hypothetical protein